MADTEHAVYLLFHLLGFGALLGALFGGIAMGIESRRALEAAARVVVSRNVRRAGIQSVVAVLILLGSGIGLMASRHIGLFSWGWLTAKHIAFGMMLASGVLHALEARRRPQEAAADGGGAQRSARQVTLTFGVWGLLLALILMLSVWRP